MNIDKLIFGTIAEEYIKLQEPISESPMSYHLYTLIHTISTIIGKRVYTVQGSDKINVNLFTAIFAKSSTTHKTSAIRNYEHMLNSLDMKEHFFTEIGSEQGLYTFLEEEEHNGHANVFMSEYSSLLAKAKMSHGCGLIDTLNNIFDGIIIKKYLKKEKVNIKKPFVNMIGASQLTSMANHADESTILSGFLPRHFICFERDRTRDVIYRPRKDKNRYDAIINELRNIKDWCADVEEKAKLENKDGKCLNMTANAIREFQRICIAKRQRGRIAGELLESSFNRAETLLLKIAIIIEVANKSSRLQDVRNITTDSLKRANDIIDYHLDCYQKVVGKELAFTEYEKNKNKVLDWLDKQTTWKSPSQVNQYTRVQTGKVKQICQDLAMDNMLFENNNTGRGTRYGTKDFTN